MQAVDYQDRARELDAAIREHRRAEKKHRIAGQNARAELRDLLAFCQAAGIEIVTEE
jgi:hypothetical protein